MGFFKKAFKKIGRSLSKHAKRAISKEGLLGKKRTYFMPLMTWRKDFDNMRHAAKHGRWKGNIAKSVGGGSRHASGSVVSSTANTAQSVPMLRSSSLGSTGFRRYTLGG